MAIPTELEESAKIDGANDVSILFRIILPLSKPVLATLALWAAVGHWNAWFDAVLYVTDQNKQVFAIFLREIVITNTDAETFGRTVVGNFEYTSSIKANHHVCGIADSDRVSIPSEVFREGDDDRLA